MAVAEQFTSTAADRVVQGLPWPTRRTFETLDRSPALRLPLPAMPRERFVVDRVRATPAASPTVSMNIGATAIGLGLWGTLFPNSVKSFLGIKAHPLVVQTVFGARELWSGYTLAGDPTKSEMLWTRLAADVFDVVALMTLDNPGNPKRTNVRVALAAVLGITALDAITAVRMTDVRRNCR